MLVSYNALIWNLIVYNYTTPLTQFMKNSTTQQRICKMHYSVVRSHIYNKLHMASTRTSLHLGWNFIFLLNIFDIHTCSVHNKVAQLVCLRLPDCFGWIVLIFWLVIRAFVPNTSCECLGWCQWIVPRSWIEASMFSTRTSKVLWNFNILLTSSLQTIYSLKISIKIYYNWKQKLSFLDDYN